ncbi:RNA polymerase-associated protein rtf1 [Purpureocillium takamizusanense]|uniref:RNA polymerase-associated protein rtf1 n=1 Tax=Purpureocillium takamizusanense TaxID=2060973 RepID=A0A9Q8QBC3_9HYPO|nr:RNA polymerase-associated protein rtf1 [Purpureocillium takamizusanense]UNI15826.1 RNA polymerase-associated protein rtf1 [Purpureocillium takamizusanense]
MADIDDELLALAGGDSEDEGSVRSSRRPSPSPPPRDSGKSKKAKRAPKDDESEEEGEAISRASSPNSLESAPMDESDSDDEQPSRARAAAAPRGGDDDKYPVDGMFMSQTEKAEIMALREVEREQIIADRISEIERQRQNRLLRQMVTTAENEERKAVKKKRSADTAELEDDDRRSSRQRTGKPAETAMDSLRRARAEKQRRKEDHERRKDYSPRRDSREPESDDDFGRRRSLTPEKELDKELPPPELKDYEKVRVGRNQFAQVCQTPGFEAAITGCYIRVAVGTHPETGIEQYRMALIKGFTTSRPYAIMSPNGAFVTDQYVKAAHGKSVKEFPFIAASNGKFDAAELNRYQITCNNEGVTLPTREFLWDKVDAINALLAHKWTSEEIKARLAKRNELKRQFDPAERERVARLLDEAASRGDEEEADRLQQELDKLGNKRLAFKTTLGPSKLTDTAATSTEQDWLAERNRENRRMNAELVRKAQLKEKAKAREVERAISRGEAVPDDPSRRLRTKAKFVHDVNDTPQKPSQNGSAASTPANGGTPKVAPTKPQMASHLAKLQEKKYEESKGLPMIHKPLMDDDVIGALDLDIDVEI